jgi:hypothetical protein
MEEHHILPKRFGGGDHKENLVTLCASCHRAVESIYDKDFWTSVGLRPSGDSNTVQEFIDRRLSLDESYGATPKSEVYQWYADWCRAGDIEPVSQHKFTKKLKRLPSVKSERAYIRGEQRRCFAGVIEKPLVEAE